MSMKFSVEMSELRRKINFVRNGLGSSKSDLSVTTMRFEFAGSKVVIFAASKEMFCRTEMKVSKEEGSSEGSFTALGNKLVSLISQVEVEMVNFTIDQENMEVQAGFLTVNFELYDGATLSTIEKGASEHLKEEGLVANRAALEEALACAKTCTVTNSIRPDVTHVELRSGRVLSSDGRKIMIYSHDGFPKEVGLKVPSGILNSVLSAVKNMDGENIQIFEGSSFYFLKAGLNEFSAGIRKVERTFPAVEGQISAAENPSDEVSIDKNVLVSMIRGVSLGLPSEEVKINMVVDGVDSEAYVEIQAANTLGRKSHERASCGRKSSAKSSFPISFKHLLETLSVFKGDSVVDLMIMDKKNLLFVRDTTDVREVVTVIPFRTADQEVAEKKEAEALAEARKVDVEEAEEGVEMAEDALSADLED